MFTAAHNAGAPLFKRSSSLRRPHRRALNCVLVCVSVVCVCAIAVVSAIVVREYSLSEAYVATGCRLLNATYADQDSRCVFCPGVVDKTKDRKAEACHPVPLPCLRLTVAFEVRREGGAPPRHGLLYDDTNQATGQHRECSFSVCLKSREENARLVSDFAGRIAAHGNTTFRCYYHTETLDNAILEKFYSKMDVFHYLFWPSLVIVICGLVFVFAECHRKGKIVCPCDGKTASHPSSPLVASSSAGESSPSAADGRADLEPIKSNEKGKSKKGSHLTRV